jgi:hypothetical protein
MKKLLVGVLIGILATLAYGVSAAKADGPATDSGYWGMQVPHAERFMLYPCKGTKIHQAPCYWNQRTIHPEWEGRPNRSFWIITVRHRHCKKFWDQKYGRKHDFCRR